LNTNAKLSAGAKVAAVPVTVVPANDIPKGSVSSAPDEFSSSTVVAPAQLVPVRKLPVMYVRSLGRVSLEITDVAFCVPVFVIKMQ
jgi:hypothetical protein